MARWSETQQRWIFYKAPGNDNIRVPKRSFSSLEYLNPIAKWVIAFQEDGHLECFDNWDGVAEYDTQQDAASVIADAQAEHPQGTEWRVIRHPLA